MHVTADEIMRFTECLEREGLFRHLFYPRSEISIVVEQVAASGDIVMAEQRHSEAGSPLASGIQHAEVASGVIETIGT